jgi:hypothetical protein
MDDWNGRVFVLKCLYEFEFIGGSGIEKGSEGESRV